MDVGETIVSFGAIGFWIFIAAVSVAGIWDGVKKREAQHETMRKIIESDKKIDDALIDKLLQKTDGSSKNLDRDLMVGGLITLFVAPGLAILGNVIGGNAVMPLTGVALLVACIAMGLIFASKYVAKYNDKS